MTKKQVEKRGPGRPRVFDDLQRFHVAFEAPLMERVQRSAKRQGVAVTDWLRSAAEAKLEGER
jgi:cytidylate kinase